MASRLARQQQRQTEQSTADLVRHILELGDDDEDIQEQAASFCRSQFKYHRFLAVDSHKVRRIYTGLIEKFRIHTLPEQAHGLELLVPRFLARNVSLEEEAQPRSDLHFGLLHLVAILADSPTNAHYTPNFVLIPPAAPRQTNGPPSKTLTWREFGGEPEPAYFSDGDDDSDWSDLDDVIAEAERIVQRVLNPYEITSVSDAQTKFGQLNSSQLPAPPAIAEDEPAQAASLMKELECLILPATTLHDSGIFTAPPEPEENPHTLFSLLKHSSDMASFWHSQQGQISSLDHYKLPHVIPSELVIRETLWMLAGIEPAVVYRVIKGENGSPSRLEPAPHIQVPHLTPEALHSMLAMFASVGTAVNWLHSMDAAFNSPDAVQPSRTCQAFCAAALTYLNEISREFLQSDDLSGTLIQLSAKLRPHLTRILRLQTLAEQACPVKSWPSSSSSKPTDRQMPNAELAANLLSALGRFASEQESFTSTSTPDNAFLGLFLDTFTPMAASIDAWLSRGELTDPSQEFFIIADSSKGDLRNGEWWTDYFKIRAPDKEGQRVVPNFLEEHLEQILVTGKSLNALATLGGEKRETSTDAVFIKMLLHAVRDFVSSDEPEELHKQHALHTAMATLPEASVVQDECTRLLEDNFSVLEQMPWQHVLAPSCTVRSRTSVPDPLGNASHAVNRAIREFIATCHKAANKRLMDALRVDHGLAHHIGALRDYLLMAAGDCMQHVCGRLFAKVARGEMWQNDADLNMLLFTSLETFNLHHIAKRLLFSVETRTYGRDIKALDGLALRYEVPWPCNLALTTKVQDSYQQVFRFLLKLKRAKWALDEIAIKDVPRLSKSKFPIHKLQLMRAKLLHAVRLLSDYIMMRILQSLSAEFEERLATEITSIDELQSLHERYLEHILDRCLLQKKAKPVHDAMITILAQALRFREMWDAMCAGTELYTEAGPRKLREADFAKLDVDFSRCNHFLGTLLRRLAARGTLPHVDYLSQALMGWRTKSTDFLLWPSQ
eukprot:m.40509 g.40509  ORF g.40509 m.40509 type:complete len:1008 (-) comp6001_c0_seq2:111-3134(-)